MNLYIIIASLFAFFKTTLTVKFEIYKYKSDYELYKLIINHPRHLPHQVRQLRDFLKTTPKSPVTLHGMLYIINHGLTDAAQWLHDHYGISYQQLTWPPDIAAFNGDIQMLKWLYYGILSGSVPTVHYLLNMGLQSTPALYEHALANNKTDVANYLITRDPIDI